MISDEKIGHAKTYDVLIGAGAGVGDVVFVLFPLSHAKAVRLVNY